MTTRLRNIDKALSAIISECNIMADNAMLKIDVVREFSRTHRTLQQSFVRIVIVPILVHLAKNEAHNEYDARNEAACKLAAKMLENLTEDDFYLPLV